MKSVKHLVVSEIEGRETQEGEFTGPGSKQKAIAKAKRLTVATHGNSNDAALVYRAEFDRAGVLLSGKTVFSIRIS